MTNFFFPLASRKFCDSTSSLSLRPFGICYLLTPFQSLLSLKWESFWQNKDWAKKNWYKVRNREINRRILL
jgi:hypothetical protein